MSRFSSRRLLPGKSVMDAVTGFYVDVLGRLIGSNRLATADRMLVVCGGPLDRDALTLAGFSDVTITNVDAADPSERQDAEHLTFADRSFDAVVVHAGLHHCRSPHRALLEMYRVARKCVVVIESRDSLLMRMAARLGLTDDYELEAVSGNYRTGGVANGPIPNFIYRWTEREVKKTLASYDPGREQLIEFFYDLRLPEQRLAQTGRPLLGLAAKAIGPLAPLFVRLAPRQCNSFAFAASKSALKPWMASANAMSRDYAREHRRIWRKRAGA